MGGRADQTNGEGGTEKKKRRGKVLSAPMRNVAGRCAAPKKVRKQTRRKFWTRTERLPGRSGREELTGEKVGVRGGREDS